MNKPRAKRNHTITLTSEERHILNEKIAYAHTWDATQWENTIICADLLEVIDRIPDGVADSSL